MKINSFRKFLTNNIPDNYNLLSRESLILEAIINPGEINILTLDVDSLNKQFFDLNIKFEQSTELYGNADKNDIFIFVPKDVKKEELQAMIGHEIIHREQYKRSKTFESETKKIVKEINDLATEFNKTHNMKILEKRNKLLNYFLYSNIYEMMAYAYQLVKDRKSYGLNSIDEIVEYFSKFLEVKVPKKFINYVRMYWVIKDKI